MHKTNKNIFCLNTAQLCKLDRPSIDDITLTNTPTLPPQLGAGDNWLLLVYRNEVGLFCKVPEPTRGDNVQ